MSKENIQWESLSADMSGEEVVVIQILDTDDEKRFALVRKDIDEENETQLTRLTRRELYYLSQQADDAIMNDERRD